MIRGEKDELDSAIIKYRLDNLLLLIAEKTREMYLDGESLRTVNWQRNRGSFIEKFQQIMPVWGLAELSYRAILNSNDYRSIDADFEELCKLNNLLAKISDHHADASGDGRTTILWGLPQAQFWWQEISRNKRSSVDNFLRYYLLLNEMPKFFPERKNPDVDLREITGFGIVDFSKLLFAIYAWLLTTATAEIGIMRVEPEVTAKNPVLTTENIKKCIACFTGDYDYFRLPTHLNNPIFFRPIIKTQTNRYIISNVFIWSRKFYEGIYWLIRDHYYRKSSQDFINAFGQYYEKYIEKLLEYYSGSITYHRIEEDGRADWFLDVDEYLIIVEQKSSLMSTQLKKAYPNMEQLDIYLDKFCEACRQLLKTEKCLTSNGKTVVKIILHFEKLHFQEPFIKPELLKKLSPEFQDLKRYYLVDTEEFEQLIQILSEDKSLFKEIIQAKIEYEVNPPPIVEGRDFADIIKKKKQWRQVGFLASHRSIFDSLIAV